MDNEPEEQPTEPSPPLWHSEEWKPGRWAVVKGEGQSRQFHGPSFGAQAEIFPSEEEADSVATRLNEEESAE